MEDKKDNTEQQIFKVLNREFDISTPEGKAQLQGFTEALAASAGKNAQEKDQLQKKYESLSQQYSFQSENVDFQEAKQKVAEMREQGISEDQIDEYWLNFSQLATKKASTGNDYDVFWAEYKGKRPELFESLTKMEQDMYKKHIKETYLETLKNSENPLVFMDQLFEGKLRNTKQPDAEEKIPSALGGSRSAKPLSQNAPKNQDVDDLEAKEREKELSLMDEFMKGSV